MRETPLAEAIRVKGVRILATLTRVTGSLPLAEDAVQEAVVAALREWPATGVPEQPDAWLTVTARRKAIDLIRRESLRTGKEREAAELVELSKPDLPPERVVRDDQLRLIFTCCHPALAPEARVALALRTLCGLSTAEVAAVLLTTEPAMAKRLTRTRQKIAAARIPYRVPSTVDLPERLTAVCGVIHALYTTGHVPLDGEAVCAEAIRLARLLHELMPEEVMPAGVLSLLLLTEARRPARIAPDGTIVVLSEQDRSCWDHALIAEGLTLLNASLKRTGGNADPYQLQAAIAAEHARASDYASTDWPEIVRLYDLLLSVAPSPAALLSRAVAVSEADGALAGLSAMETVPASPRSDAVRAELLARLGRYAEAALAVEASLEGEMTEPERRYREGQLARYRRALPA